MAKDVSARIAELKYKQEEIGKKLNLLEQKAKTESRKRETRCKIIIGGLVMAEMDKNQALAETVRCLIASGVTRPHDKAAIAGMLPNASNLIRDAADVADDNGRRKSPDPAIG